jgi:phosphoglycerate dehydrogenase-like enzyme
MSRPTVVFLNRWAPLFPEAVVRRHWGGLDAEIVFAHTQDPAEMVAAFAPATAIVMAWNKQRVGEPVFEKAPGLRLVQKLSAAYDDVDVTAASLRGIVCCQNAGANAPAVAEHVVMMALAQRRRLVPGHLGVAAGRWEPVEMMAAGLHEIGGATVGLVGFGQIGQAIAERLSGFGVNLLVSQRRPVPAALADRYRIRQVPLDDLLATSDIVSWQVPLSPETTHLIDERRLALLKDGATLINVARGPVIAHGPLVAELRSGRIQACLDVFDAEPVDPADPLLTLPNVVLSPHLAGLTHEVRDRVLALAGRNLARLFDGGTDFEGLIG